MQWDLLPYMLPLGLLTEGILHANNTRDIAMDTKAGIITLAGLIGFDASRALFVAMLALSYISSLWLALTQYYGNALVLLTLPIALNLVRTFQPKVHPLSPFFLHPMSLISLPSIYADVLMQWVVCLQGLSMMPENVAKLHCVYGGLTILGVALSQRFPLQ
jgi:1,4-dihydroxy-2-naphthoate octaprenyltransferase